MFEIIREDNTYKYLYSGKWIHSINQNTIEVKSLYDNNFLGSIQSLTKAEAINCIKDCRNAAQIWNNSSLQQKKHLIGLTADLILAYKNYLTEITMRETGKDLKASEKEISKAYNILKQTDQNWEKIFSNDKIKFTKNKPRGIILSICSSHYPIYSSTIKFATALISGNCVILMPPIRGTISALHIAELFNRSCNVNGVINTVTGTVESLTEFIITNKNIDFIDFTGNDVTARQIAMISPNIPMNIEIEDSIIEISETLTQEELDKTFEHIRSMTINR